VVRFPKNFVVSTIASIGFHHIFNKKIKIKFLHHHFRCLPLYEF